MPVGEYQYLVVFQDPGPPLPDGVGGYTQQWTDIPPGTWRVSLKPAGVADLERLAAGTVVSPGAFVVEGHYHGGVSTTTRMLYNGKTYSVTGMVSVGSRPPKMQLAVVEQVRP